MSSQDLDKAIKSINESASRTNTTTDFFNSVLDGGQSESVQNPLTGVVVPSVQKAVYDQYKNDINQIHQDVVDSNSAADRAEAAANAVWNRRIVYSAVNASFADYQEDGRTLTPRLSFDGSQYLPTFDSSVPVTFTGLPRKNGDGTITVATDKGDRQFSRVIAEAVSRSDVGFVGGSSFGIVGNGVSDDTGALVRALSSEHRELHLTGNINVSKPVSVTIKSDMKIVSDARIVYVGSDVVDKLVSIDCNGHNLTINGLGIDGKLLTHTPLLISNNTDTYTDVLLNNLNVSNARKTNTNLQCDGINVTGAFINARITNTTVNNVLMASGAGVSGRSGVTGIIVKASSQTRYPRKVIIDGCQISEVRSEVLSYTMDQDGIKVYSKEDEAGIVRPDDQLATISNTKFVNCVGRAIKTQNQRAVVKNIEIVRDFDRGNVAIWGIEIDFQTGGGFVRDVNCTYLNKSAPLSIVLANSPQTSGKRVPHTSVRGVHVYTECTGDHRLQNVVRVGARNTNDAPVCNVSDIEVIGEIDYVVGANAEAGTTDVKINVSDVFASPNISLVGVYGTMSTGSINTTNCWFTGTGKGVLWDSRSSTSIYEVSSSNCVGWEDVKRVSGTIQGNVERISAFAARDTVNTGVFRPVSFTLEVGETFKFPESAYNVQAGMIVISVGHGRDAQGIIAVDGSEAVIIAGGNNFVCGGTTAPDNGLYRIWTGSNGPFISNHSTVKRTFTCMMIG
ncbi:MAG: hypothetical protein ACRCXB_20030 [Aeromonadaceae bacterium]